MQAVAAHLTDAKIIDASAYIGSRGPWTRAEMGEAMHAESVEAPPRARLKTLPPTSPRQQ